MTAVVHVLESGSDHIHMIVGIYSTGDAETEKVKTSETVLTSHRITVSEDVTDLAATYTGLDVELAMTVDGS